MGIEMRMRCEHVGHAGGFSMEARLMSMCMESRGVVGRRTGTARE